MEASAYLIAPKDVVLRPFEFQGKHPSEEEVLEWAVVVDESLSGSRAEVGPLVGDGEEGERLLRVLTCVEDVKQRYLRHLFTSVYGFGVPGTQVLQAIQDEAGPDGVLEVGAGNGYWAHLLAAKGISITATDNHQWRQGTAMSPLLTFNHVWHPVQDADAATAVTTYPTKTPLLVWPYPNQSWASQVLALTQSPVIFIAGEVGSKACTMDPFEGHADWTVGAVLDLPNWPGVRDVFRVMRRVRHLSKMGNCDSAPSSRRSSRSSSSRQGLRRVSSEVKIGRAGSLSRSMPRRLDSVNSSPRRMESVGSAGGHSQLKAIVSMRKRQAELEKRGSTASTMVKTEEKRSLGDTGKTWSYALKKPPPNPWESTTDDYDKYLNQYSLMCDRDGVEAFDKWKEDKGLDELGDMIPESSCSDSDEEFACSVKFQPPVHAKAGHELRTITRCLRTSALFTKLRDEEFEVFAKAAQTVGFRKGEEVFKHGSIPLPSKAGLYCIAEGRVGLNSQGLVMNSLCPGQCFGEQTAVSPSLRSNCTVVTQSPVTCYFIPSDVCLPLLGQHEEARRNEYLAIMDNIEYLKGLKRVQLIRLCDLLEEVAYKKDETIIEFNKQATHFYFILQGTVKVVGREAVSDTIIPTVTKHICDCKEGDPLGHLEMFELPSVSCANDPFDTTPVVKEAPRSIADVIATSEEVITARLSKSDFESCLTSTAEPLKDMVGRSADYAYYRDTAGMAFPEEKKPVVLSHPKYSMQRHVNRP